MGATDCPSQQLEDYFPVPVSSQLRRFDGSPWGLVWVGETQTCTSLRLAVTQQRAHKRTSGSTLLRWTIAMRNLAFLKRCGWSPPEASSPSGRFSFAKAPQLARRGRVAEGAWPRAAVEFHTKWPPPLSITVLMGKGRVIRPSTSNLSRATALFLVFGYLSHQYKTPVLHLVPPAEGQ